MTILRKKYKNGIIKEAVLAYVNEHYEAPGQAKAAETASEYATSADTENRPGVQFQIYDEPENLDRISSLLRMPLTEADARALNSLLDENRKRTFVEQLLILIDRRGVKDSKVYKAAQIDRRLFSKMVSDRQYKPAKDTAIALALALKCSLEEADDLLERAGYTLSRSSRRDLMLEYFFREKIYDITLINMILYQMDQKILGR